MNDAPGPGAYDSRIDGAKDKAPAFSMGGRHNPRGGDANPGPGNYDPDINKVREKAPGFGMGKGGRGGGKINDAPGPGNYYLPEKKGGGITMGARMNQRGPSDGPGPGAYDGDYKRVKEDGPKYGFGSPSKGGKGVADGPGPGNYDTPGYFNPANKPGGFSFGKDAPKPKGNDLPGPGHYYIPVKVADVPDYANPGQNKDYRVV